MFFWTIDFVFLFPLKNVCPFCFLTFSSFGNLYLLFTFYAVWAEGARQWWAFWWVRLASELRRASHTISQSSSSSQHNCCSSVIPQSESKSIFKSPWVLPLLQPTLIMLVSAYHQISKVYSSSSVLRHVYTRPYNAGKLHGHCKGENQE